MSKMVNHMKKMLLLVDDFGIADEVHLGDWLGKSKRIDISGKTHDGREFTLTLEIEKEAKQNAEELE